MEDDVLYIGYNVELPQVGDRYMIRHHVYLSGALEPIVNIVENASKSFIHGYLSGILSYKAMHLRLINGILDDGMGTGQTTAAHPIPKEDLESIVNRFGRAAFSSIDTFETGGEIRES